eukprot:6225908-Prymnesium_polylepis.1
MLHRLDDATALLALPPVPAYDLLEPETISLTIPAAALVSNGTVAARWPFVIRPTSLELRGPLLPTADEADLRDGSSSRLLLIVRRDAW